MVAKKAGFIAGIMDPSEIQGSLKSGDAVVVIDVFRATSTLQCLVDQGCRVKLVSDPQALTGGRVTEEFLVGEWSADSKIAFDADNSPVEVLRRGFFRKRIAFLSSNGVPALLAASRARTVACGNLFSQDALTELIRQHRGKWWMIPAGCRGERRPEDDYLATRICSDLQACGADLTVRALRHLKAHPARSQAELRSSPGAQFLRDRGADEDLDFILAGRYASKLVPVLMDGEIVGVDPQAVALGPSRISFPVE